MTRKEIVECLEQLDLAETLFIHEKESRALKRAIRIIKYDLLTKRACAVVVIAIIAAALTGFVLGIMV